MLTAIRHPYTAMTYEVVGENRVQVQDGNQTGLFDRSGRWLEGDLKSADPSFCRYVASAWVIAERRRTLGKAYQ
jgi:hypothetical protein